MVNLRVARFFILRMMRKHISRIHHVLDEAHFKGPERNVIDLRLNEIANHAYTLMSRQKYDELEDAVDKLYDTIVHHIFPVGSNLYKAYRAQLKIIQPTILHMKAQVVRLRALYK